MIIVTLTLFKLLRLPIRADTWSLLRAIAKWENQVLTGSGRVLICALYHDWTRFFSGLSYSVRDSGASFEQYPQEGQSIVFVKHAMEMSTP